MEPPQPVWANWSCCPITLIVKKCFLILNVLCPLSLFHSLNTTKKSLVPSSLSPCFRYIIHIHKIPLRFVFSRQGCPNPPRLSSYERCSNPTTIFVTLQWTQASISMCLLMWGLNTPAVPHQGWVMQDIISALTQREEIAGKTFKNLVLGINYKISESRVLLKPNFPKDTWTWWCLKGFPWYINEAKRRTQDPCAYTLGYDK